MVLKDMRFDHFRQICPPKYCIFFKPKLLFCKLFASIRKSKIPKFYVETK